MTTGVFENCLNRLHVQIHMLQDSKGLVGLDDSNCDAAQALLEQASKERDAGDSEAAWASLVDAANAIGHIRGLSEASYLKTPEYEVRKLLGTHGSRGGTAKGRNGDQKRLEVVNALVKATPTSGWASGVS